MENQSTDKFRHLALAAILGAAAGAIAALLLAPDKGSNTRRKLAEGAGEMADKLKKKVMSDNSSPEEEYPV